MTKNVVFMIAAMLLASSMGMFLATVPADAVTSVPSAELSYTIHAPIRIDGNGGFAAVASSGDGTAGNPWIIEGWDINGTGIGYCIYIGNTTQFFEVRNCYLHHANGRNVYPYYYSTGLTFNLVSNGKAFNNTVTVNDIFGIYLYASSGNKVENNTMTLSASYGMHIDASDNNKVANNTASNNQIGIRVYSSLGNSITNNTAVSNTNRGIEIWSAPNNAVSYNNASSNLHDGIYVGGSAGSTISWNTASYNGDRGINFGSGSPYYAHNNTANDNDDAGICVNVDGLSIVNNHASRNRYGIEVLYGDDTILDGNTADANREAAIRFMYCGVNYVRNNAMNDNGIYFEGGNIPQCTSLNIDASNTVNGKPVRYWVNQTGGTVPAGAGQVILANCSGVTVENQDLSNSSVGVLMMYADNNLISHNTVNNNSMGYTYGVLLSEFCSNNTIENNTAKFNKYSIAIFDDSYDNVIRYNDVISSTYGISIYSDRNDLSHNYVYGGSTGIDIQYSNGCIVDHNTVANNTKGINFVSANGNRLFANQILENGVQASDNGANFWNATYPVGGNYWSEYVGDDHFSGAAQSTAGSDGFIDIGYNIPSGSNVDAFPIFVDVTDPVSSLDTIDPYWLNDVGRILTVTAADDSTVASVELWFSYCDDNATWPGYAWGPVDSYAADGWWFQLPGITDGYYRFYTIANDMHGNVESAPAAHDSACALDTTEPAAAATGEASGEVDTAYTFAGTVSDNLALGSVYVNYWYGTGSQTNATMVHGAGNAYTFAITLPANSTDTLHYRIAAVDLAGNWNSTAVLDVAVVDSESPVANAGQDQSIPFGELVTFDGANCTDNVGVSNFTWTFTYNGSQITLYGVAPQFSFWTAGEFTITLNATDASGNWAVDEVLVTVTPQGDDADGDGWSDAIEIVAGTDPQDASDMPADADGDGIADFMDSDYNTQYVNQTVWTNATEYVNTTNNVTVDVSNADTDGDGWTDAVEIAGGTDPLDATDMPADADADGIADFMDTPDAETITTTETPVWAWGALIAAIVLGILAALGWMRGKGQKPEAAETPKEQP